jgi:small subunit ribosomal protein S6
MAYTKFKTKKSGFIIIWIQCSGEVLIAFETEFRRDERVMRFLTVSLDKHAYFLGWRRKIKQKLKSSCNITTICFRKKEEDIRYLTPKHRN